MNSQGLPMKTTVALPQVGVPDPEMKTSPILDGDVDIDETLSLDTELESGVCYFNNVKYAIGQYVHSGDDLLRCEPRGVWVRKGAVHP